MLVEYELFFLLGWAWGFVKWRKIQKFGFWIFGGIEVREGGEWLQPSDGDGRTIEEIGGDGIASGKI